MEERKRRLQEMAEARRNRKKRAPTPDSDSDPSHYDEEGEVLPCYTDDFVEGDDHLAEDDDFDFMRGTFLQRLKGWCKSSGSLWEVPREEQSVPQPQRESGVALSPLPVPSQLSADQIARMEANRRRAMEIRQERTSGIIRGVPRDVMMLVFRLLSPWDVVQCCGVWKVWREIASSDVLWEFFLRRKGLDGAQPGHVMGWMIEVRFGGCHCAGPLLQQEEEGLEDLRVRGCVQKQVEVDQGVRATREGGREEGGGA